MERKHFLTLGAGLTVGSLMGKSPLSVSAKTQASHQAAWLDQWQENSNLPLLTKRSFDNPNDSLNPFDPLVSEGSEITSPYQGVTLQPGFKYMLSKVFYLEGSFQYFAFVNKSHECGK